MIVLVNVYCFCPVVKVFHQYFRCFSKLLLEYMTFRRFDCDTFDIGYLVFFLFSCRNFFRIRQELLEIVLYKVEFYVCKRVLFRGIFENASVYFLFRRYCYNDYCFVGLYQGLLYFRSLIQKNFLLKFYRSCVYSCNLICGTCVLGEPNNSCLCSCCWTTITLVIFAR